jgi:malonate-semialdehyde dehydrogenase (acetylating)/methylmalonate-semialdehyde dehydrogenase
VDGGPALATGNAFILKPSERDPSVPNMLAELFWKRVVRRRVQCRPWRQGGGRRAARPSAIKAVSFVGSSDIANYVYQRGAAAGKRMQCMGGAKNHGIVLPDADFDQVVSDILGAAYGSAGERCMALPVVVPVGEKTADELRERLITGSPGSRSASRPIRSALWPRRLRPAQGADRSLYPDGRRRRRGLVLDGRGFTLPGHEEGFFLAPTFFDRVTATMKTYQDEIFGPVLQIVRAASVEEAIALASDHPYGNGVAMFTRNGAAARAFAAQVQVGMVGINVPIPVPVAYHSFGGWKRSGFGDLNQYGMDGIRFFTRTKTVTQRWPDTADGVIDQSFVIPTMR